MPYIPNLYGQATINFAGENLPNDGALVIGFANEASDPAVACAEDIWDCFATAVPLICSADVAMTSVDVKLGPNDTGPIATFAGAPVSGATGPTSLSPGSAILIEKQSDLGGRRGRGRMYWPGVFEGWVDDAGRYVTGVQAQIQGFANDLLADLNGVLQPMYLLHSPAYTWEIQGGQPRRVYGSLASAGMPTEVTALAVDPVIATQRRRLR